MRFVESASPLTLRSYEGDLAQAFGNYYSKDQSSAGRAGERNSTRLAPLNTENEAQLLRQARAAQRSWAELSPASRNRKAGTLKSLFGWLHREGLVSRDLASLVYAPQVPMRLPKHISVDEAVALLRSCENQRHASSEDNLKFVLVAVLYGGGLRVSEACALKVQDIDFNNQTCRVRGKGAKERIIALPAFTINAIKKLVSLRRSAQYVFPAPGSENSGDEASLSTRTAYEWVRKAGASAGLLRPLHPHALRHSYATHLLRSGANLRVLQALLGHANLQATSRYTHIGIDQLARTLESHHPLGEDSKDKT